ncbi:MAG: hypothetical protein ACM3S5_09480 [Rhodospirillales bacterium]
MRCFLAFALAVLATMAAGQQRKSGSQPQLEVLAFTAQRTPNRTVEIEGRIRNCWDRPLRKIIMRFRVLGPDNVIVTTQRGVIEPEILEPDEEAEFHWQMREPARAVSIMIEAADTRDIELIVAKAGPYAIE